MHSAIMGIASLGVLGKLSSTDVYNDICRAIAASGRDLRKHVNDARRTVEKAFRTCKGDNNFSTFDFPAKASVEEDEMFHDGFCNVANVEKGVTEYDLCEASNPRLSENADDDGKLLLQTLYDPEDFLCLGEDRYAKTVKKRDEWIELIEKNGSVYSLFMINPFTGEFHRDQSGKTSQRCNAAVRKYKYVLGEFDPPKGSDLFPLQQQLEFWASITLPIAALTYSENKSIHAIISLCGEVNSESEWDELVKGRIFRDLLAPLGADTNTANPARFSRFPGFLRDGNLQKLLYIDGNPSCNGIFGESA
jgi:hypothetical protein